MRMDPIFVFADAGTHISDHNRAKTVRVYITLHPRQKQRQHAIAHACGWVCRWWDTYITPQACCYGPHVYYASSTAKTKTKRHCACVWMDLQMVGHVYHTTIALRQSTCTYYASSTAKTRTKRHCACVLTGWQMVGHVYHTTSVLLWSTCILRFIHGKNKDKSPLRMRVDGFVDGGHVYRTTIALRQSTCILRLIRGKNKDKTPLRMRVDGFADGGTRISHHNRAKTVHVYITPHPRQKQRQNAIAHACGWVCRWWETYITPQSR